MHALFACGVLAILAAAAFVLSGCSGAGLLNFTVPSGHYDLRKDVAYGQGRRMKMDIYVPVAQAPAAGRCGVVFFYGGSWQAGSKDIYKFVGQALSSMGCVAFIPDYRLYPAVRYPAFLDDSARAFAWAHDHMQDYGVAPGRLLIAGHSAGAYNAMMLTLRPDIMQKAGGDSSWIGGMIGIAGPYDFLPFTDDKIVDIFSTEKDALTQPIHYARPGLPPVFLAHGDADDEVALKNTLNMAAALEKMGNSVETRVYPGVGHVGIITSLASVFRGRTPLYEDMRAFIGGIGAGGGAQ